MNEVKKPRCTKCQGVLIPERDLSGRTISVGCAICGDRIFRGVERRHPKPGDHRLGAPQSYGGKRL